VRADPPKEFETGALIDFLADGWGLPVVAVDYAAVGGGSYHWIVNDPDGRCGFATADDLDLKPWLGDTRESVFEGLSRSFGTAVALRHDGLGFVTAPIPTSSGETLRRFGSHYTVALFPFVAGQAGTWGDYETAERAALLAMLADLHQAKPVVESVARRVDLAVPGRGRLEVALQELNQTWTGGPFSEPARKLLAPHAAYVGELLSLFDRLLADVATRSSHWVVTHGEPHGGNLMRTDEGYVLVDWDTVALAPRERDLWMLAEETGAYTDATGHEPDEVGVNFFRLTWDLEDIAAFTGELRSPHEHDDDTEKAYEALTYYLTTRERWASLLDSR
jgi:spectinomycin phosphotransferase